MTRQRLGRSFNQLLAAAACSNTGDGIRLAAGPLLVVSHTQQPLPVAAAVLAQQLPWVLLSLPAGAWIDRVDRRRLLVAVTLARTALAALLCLAVAADAVTLAMLYAVLFAVGCAEVVADNSAAALVPTLVSAAHLPSANARLSAAFTIGNQFAGPPLGAWSFVAAAAWPFGIETAAFAAAAVLLLGVHGAAAARTTDVPATASSVDPPVDPPVDPLTVRSRGWLRRDVSEGVRWLWHQPAVRLLAVVLAVMNVTFSAAFAVWVLFSAQRLGLSGAGFGWLLTASAAGALAGAAAAAPAMARFGPATLLRAGLVVETAVLAALAMTRHAWLAGAVMVLFGVHAALWGVVALTVRQRLVPEHLRGRVGSVYFLLVMGGSALGSAVGGLLATALGVVGPFWVGAVADALLTVVVWRALGTVLRSSPDPVEVPGATPDPEPDRGSTAPPDPLPGGAPVESLGEVSGTAGAGEPGREGAR